MHKLRDATYGRNFAYNDFVPQLDAAAIANHT
jgi:hypothetical protein